MLNNFIFVYILSKYHVSQIVSLIVSVLRLTNGGIQISSPTMELWTGLKQGMERCGNILCVGGKLETTPIAIVVMKIKQRNILYWIDLEENFKEDWIIWGWPVIIDYLCYVMIFECICYFFCFILSWVLLMT